VTFILLGKYLEASAKGRTSAAIQALLTLAPPTALLLEGGDADAPDVPAGKGADAAGHRARGAHRAHPPRRPPEGAAGLPPQHGWSATCS